MFSKEILHAVDDVDLTINEREIVALVGESGSGKSTIARLLARHLQADRRRDLLPRPAAERPALAKGHALVPRRGPMVFQDPFSAFNPVHRISHGIMRNLALHRPELSAAASAGGGRAGQ